jgi:hypothetical protein
VLADNSADYFGQKLGFRRSEQIQMAIAGDPMNMNFRH